jgi:hypothetical protein
VATLGKLQSLGKILKGTLSTQLPNTIILGDGSRTISFELNSFATLGDGSSTSASDYTTLTFSIHALGTKNLFISEIK